MLPILEGQVVGQGSAWIMGISSRLLGMKERIDLGRRPMRWRRQKKIFDNGLFALLDLISAPKLIAMIQANARDTTETMMDPMRCVWQAFWFPG
jgi:hypothetical protein